MARTWPFGPLPPQIVFRANFSNGPSIENVRTQVLTPPNRTLHSFITMAWPHPPSLCTYYMTYMITRDHPVNARGPYFHGPSPCKSESIYHMSWSVQSALRTLATKLQYSLLEVWGFFWTHLQKLAFAFSVKWIFEVLQNWTMKH